MILGDINDGISLIFLDTPGKCHLMGIFQDKITNFETLKSSTPNVSRLDVDQRTTDYRSLRNGLGMPLVVSQARIFFDMDICCIYPVTTPPDLRNIEALEMIFPHFLLARAIGAPNFYCST